MQPYEHLLAWQRCHRLVIEIYRVTNGWPASERFGLVTQIRRAGISAASNIVEGNARRGPRELHRFLQVAAGSIAEVGYLIRVAEDLGIVEGESAMALRRACDEAARLTWLLLRGTAKATRGLPSRK